MKYKKWPHKIRYFFQFIPFTWNTVLVCLIGWGAYRLLHKKLPKEELATNAHYPLMQLMGSFILFLLLALVALSILSAIATWLYFMWLRRQQKTQIELEFIQEDKAGKRKKQFLEVRLPHALRPLLGFLKLRLFYDDNLLTDKFSLLSSQRKPNSLLRQAVFGKSRIALDDIKEYQIKGALLFFEDMMQLISLPLRQPISKSFYQSPDMLQQEDPDLAPKKTETMDIRIEQLRKVEGEYLNYKDFESGDDVRRIVWKVFAKSRNLVVRIPEKMEPYASHLYFYASFHSSNMFLFGGDAYFAAMLNHYKSSVWSVFQTLKRQEWQIKYIPDQTFHFHTETNNTSLEERIISNSQWQKELSLNSYFAPSKGSILLISSLNDPKELATLIEECDQSVEIIFIPLSGIFKRYVALHWLKNLFLLPSADRLSKLKSSWPFSPLRRQIKKNEQEIKKLLSKR